jgi:hypothetical protein
VKKGSRLLLLSRNHREPLGAFVFLMQGVLR